MNITDYVSSGRFKAELEARFGELERKPAAHEEADEEDDDELDALEFIGRLPDALATEVRALYELFATFEVPTLCGLSVGSFVTIPAQYELDADGVRDEEWFADDHDIDVVMQSVEVFTQSGSPFFLIGTYGVVEFKEDPHSYTVIADGLEPFLRTVIAVEAAARGNGTIAEAEAFARANLKSSPSSKPRRPSRGTIPETTARLPGFVTRTLHPLP